MSRGEADCAAGGGEPPGWPPGRRSDRRTTGGSCQCCGLGGTRTDGQRRRPTTDSRTRSLRLWKRFPAERAEALCKLGDFDCLISGDVVKNLGGAAGRPVDLHESHSRRLAEADGLLQRVAAKTASRRDMAVDRERLLTCRDDLDAVSAPMAGADCSPAYQFPIGQASGCRPGRGSWKRTLWYLSPSIAVLIRSRRTGRHRRRGPNRRTPLRGPFEDDLCRKRP